jgi:vacuolar-type H+-ATPase subunit E/Vma4
VTSATGPGTGHPLEPLANALRERANRDAAEGLAQAEEQAAAILAEARARADEVLEQARAAGERDAAALLAGERARAEREARAVLLAAQQDAYLAARAAVRAAVRGLRDDPAYPALLDALRDRARQELGPGASIAELPGGGIEARCGSRRVEYGLDGLADDLLERVGGDLSELWEP